MYIQGYSEDQASRLYHAGNKILITSRLPLSAFPCMVTGILLLVPNSIAAAGVYLFQIGREVC